MPLRGRSNLDNEHFFFVTTSVVGHASLFVEDKYCDVLVHNIKYYQLQLGFAILGYVIMPSHFHWIVEVDPSKGTISDVMRDIKKYSAWDILSLLKKESNSEFEPLFAAEAVPYRDQNKKVWMKRFHDEAIRNQEMFLSRLRYIHNNPVEAGLVVRPEDTRTRVREITYSEMISSCMLIPRWLRVFAKGGGEENLVRSRYGL